MPPMEGTMADRPNILLLLSDEHSPLELGCNGARLVRTPNMDAPPRAPHRTVGRATHAGGLRPPQSLGA
jgi:hypothetical protein